MQSDFFSMHIYSSKYQFKFLRPLSISANVIVH